MKKFLFFLIIFPNLLFGQKFTISGFINDRETGELMYGEVPPYSVVVSGSMPSKNNISLYCAVIVKTVDERTRSKTGINELLRD